MEIKVLSTRSKQKYSRKFFPPQPSRHNIGGGGGPCPTFCDDCLGSLTSLVDRNIEEAREGSYGLSFLFEKTITSNHLQM